MTDKDVLTQDEIDALLTGVDEGTVDVEVDGDGDAVVDYDLTSQDQVVKGRLPTVELISERFTRLIRASLPANLKVALEVGSGGVQIMKCSEYLESLYVPTCLKLLRIQPFAGTCLLALDAKLIHRIVDRFFGGHGLSGSGESKEFSPTEQKVITRIVNTLLEDLQKSWSEVLNIEIEVIGTEVNPNLVSFMPASDLLMVTSFHIELDDSGGELHIAFPYASLEPFKRVLHATSQQDGEELDATWRVAMESVLLDAPLDLSCLIGESDIRLRDLLRMQPADVLDIEMEELHQVSVDGLPVFTATLGDSRGKFALEFSSFGSI